MTLLVQGTQAFSDHFDMLKTRASTLDQHIDAIDEPIRELVLLLNERPNIVTVWSCSGHGEVDQGYLMLACEAGGYDYLFGLMLYIFNKTGDVFYSSVSITVRSWGTYCYVANILKFKRVKEAARADYYNKFVAYVKEYNLTLDGKDDAK